MSKRLGFLDVSRGLAILGVILVHTSQYSEFHYFISNEFASLGRFGVQLFFVISGYTISMSYSKISAKGLKKVIVFYIRRFFRIIPLFLILSIYYSYKENINYSLVINPLAGLNQKYINVVSGAWSIWNEIYFYLLFPLYVVIRRSKLAFHSFAILMLSISVAINFRVFIEPLGQYSYDFDYMNIFIQLVCFIFGVEFETKKSARIVTFGLIYFLPSLCLKYWFFRDLFWKADHGAGHFLVIIALVSILILRLIEYLDSVLGYNVFTNLLRSVGRMTYTAYLLHFIILDTVFKFEFFDFGTEINFLLISLLTISLSYLLKPWTEDISSKVGKRLSDYVMDQ